MVNIFCQMHLVIRLSNRTIKSNKLFEKNAEKLINEGKTALYPSAVLSANGENLQSFYRKYVLLFTLIPLLSKKIVDKIINCPLLRKLISVFPLSTILFVKIFLNFKNGRGLLPLSILSNEIFFFKRFLKIKLRMN